MSQLTLYLDKTTEAKTRRAAEEAGISMSRWVATLIQQNLADEWPPSVVSAAGAWADFPTRAEIHLHSGSDAPREKL